MHLADHIRPLLRDHDCVIIPDFGGLVADLSSARAQPGRQALSPPTKLVAFNQALTRNDGLLVDALSQHLGLPTTQAREVVRTAVASLQQELNETNRTELPGIGIFRRAAGRGLAFEYTGTDNLLAAAFGLPELAARPIRATDGRPPRPQPALRGASTRRPRWARLLPGGVIAVAASLLLLANYEGALKGGYLPASWRTHLPQPKWAQHRPAPAITIAEPQQATLGQHDFSGPAFVPEGMTPLEAPAASPALATEPLPAAFDAETTPAIEPATAAKTAAIATAPATPMAPAKPVAPAAAPTKPVAPAAAPAKPVATKSVAPAAPPAKPVASAVRVLNAPAPARPKVAAPTAAVSPTIIKTRTGRYYVIAAAYTSLARAEQGRQVLARTGHPAHILLPPYGSRLFRLTAADYADLASAQREAQRLRLRTHQEYNTLKF